MNTFVYRSAGIISWDTVEIKDEMCGACGACGACGECGECGACGACGAYGACGTYGRGQRRVQGFGGETWDKEATGETQAQMGG